MKTLNDFNTLVDQHSREVFGYLWRMMRDQQDAEDALQETFLRAFRGFPRLKDHSNLRAWLYRTATNVAYTQLKRRDRLLSRTTNLTDINPIQISDDHEQRDLIEIVLQAVQELPHKQRAALMLRNYQGLSYEEIGIALSCSPVSARANAYQALKKLRNQFSEVAK